MSESAMGKTNLRKLLIVGLGSIGKRHIQVMQEISADIEIAVLRHIRCDDLDMSTVGADHCFTKFSEVIEFSPDAAIVANPASKHVDVAIKLAKIGVHLLIEKPISDGPDGVSQLIQLCNDRSLILMTGYNLRFLPSLARFRELIHKRQQIGRVLSVQTNVGQFLPSWRPSSDYRKTVSAQQLLGGGVLLELSHEVDYLLWIFGDAQWVFGNIEKVSDLEIDVEDTVNLILGMKGSEGHSITATVNIDFVRHDTTRTCTVIGEKGTLRWNGITGVVDVFSEGSNSWEELFSDKPKRSFTYREELLDFIAAVEDGRQPVTSGGDGLKVLDVISAAKRSQEANQRIFFEGQ